MNYLKIFCISAVVSFASGFGTRYILTLLKPRPQTSRERWAEEQRNGGHTL